MTAARIEPATPASSAPTALLALACLALGGSLGWLSWHQPQRSWPPPVQLELQLGPGHYRVAPDRLEWIEAYSRLHFEAGREQARARLEAQLETGLDRAFDTVRARLPAFADWYYSLGGEYGRLSMSLLAWLDLAEDGYVARRAAAMLFPEPEWSAALATLERDARAGLEETQARLRQGWLADLAARLEPHRVPAPLAGAGHTSGEPLRLDDLDWRLLARERAALQERITISSLAAGGTVAAVAWRGAVARSGQAAAARAVARGAPRAGAAAGGGMAACAPAGPYALACAVGAGALAWLATDWVLLRVDEALHREDLLAGLEAALDEVQVQLQQEMLAAYDAVIERMHEGAGQEITRTFRPAGARGAH